MKYRLKNPTCLLAAALAAVACSGGSSPAPAVADKAPLPPVTGPSLPPDDEVVAKLYDPAYSVPAGFFVDERANTPGSYTVYHVKDASVSYELCTDDFATAERWEADDNAARHVSGYYVGHVENDRYFEFVRELSYEDDIGNIDDVTTPGFSRVFKCSYAVRDGVDVPGRALRLIAFDRVPWPRPDIIHKARRELFGGRAYDERLTRLKLRQAYGRLIRRADDRGVFVLLDPLPSRLLDAFPPEVTAERVGLAEAVAAVKGFFSNG